MVDCCGLWRALHCGQTVQTPNLDTIAAVNEASGYRPGHLVSGIGSQLHFHSVCVCVFLLRYVRTGAVGVRNSVEGASGFLGWLCPSLQARLIAAHTRNRGRKKGKTTGDHWFTMEDNGHGRKSLFIS